MRKVLEYEAEDGSSPYADWFNALPAAAAAKITAHKLRLEKGNLSNCDPVSGVSEKKIDWGPGYRIYFGKDGDEVIILLGGGSKARQQADIAEAIACWKDYKARKRQRARKP